MTDRIVGRRLFTDGLEHDVYEDVAVRLHVFGPEEKRCSASGYRRKMYPW